MPLIRNSNIDDFSSRRDANGIKNVLEYIETQKTPIFMIFFLVKDDKENTCKVMSSMVKRDRDKSYKEQIENISQRNDFYRFLVPEKDKISIEM